ncbi:MULTISPECIES: ectoine synthase [Pseudomonas]|jgi:L-ectoine synthase|uniref:L-ectoine synthase n=2 Tax=Pseudomonas TaxID=286 RepID=A0A5E7TJ61_PSEFL|nr:MULTISPECIES: ectoine synthase [Pseudomonas]VVM14961.1 L-ectoine synthase [Pseudomonas fluorescens]AOE79286.1 L-ectoine synthase [Pseudomonas lurida]AVJ38576.1 ectoine synthase [Pseudomonas lurida]MBC3235938.1 ectoine synthase [Pseudomonas lurida]MBC3238316.1 ectoine synthase [Pseudomonas lurida]
MFIRSKADIEKTAHFVEWGAGTSHRLLTEKDQMGYTVCHTVVRAGTESLLHYRNHLEACYCIAGEGEVEDMDGNVYPIRPGDMYVLDQHDRHYLRGGQHEDLVLVSVFNPPLRGDERHNLSDTSGSSY